MSDGQDNSVQVGVQVAVLIQPSGTADVAVPVLDVTQLLAGSSLSSNVNDVVSDGQLHGHQVGNQGALSIQPSSAANGAVPVLNVTLVLATGGHSSDVLDGVSGSDLNVHDVGQLSQSGVSPNLLALVANPVLNVTVLVAGSILSGHILGRILQSGDSQGLVVGDDGASGIQVVDVAVSAVPVLGPAGVVAAGLNTLAVDSVGGAGSTQLNSHHVGNHGALGIQPSSATVGAVPVSNVTGLGAGGSLSVHSNDGVSSLLVGQLAADSAVSVAGVGVHVLAEGDDGEAVHGHAVGIPSSATVGAVPVLDVTVDLAGSLNSLNVSLVVSSTLVGQLVAVHAVSIAGIEVSVVSLGAGLLAALGAVLVAVVVVLVLAAGRLSTVHVDGDGLARPLRLHFTIEGGVLVGVLDISDVDGIVAGHGIVLHLEGDGVEQVGLNSLRGRSGTSDEVHQTVLHIAGILIDRTKSDVLVRGGVEFGADLDGGHPHLFVLIVVGFQLEHVVVKTQLDQSSDQTDALVAVQVNLDGDVVAGVNFLSVGNELNVVVFVCGYGYGCERNHSTQHQRRQKNCQNLFHFAYTFLVNIRI